MENTANARKIVHGLRSFFGKFKHVELLLEEMSELFALGEQAYEAPHLVVLGEPGMGKSRLVTYFCARHPRVEHEEVTEVPVLRVDVPSNCSPKMLAGEMLRELGSPYWNVGDLAERTFQLKTLLKACRVRLVVLDEMNHLADRGAAKTHYAAADWLKLLTDQSRLPFVLTGIPTVRALLEINDQLRDRFRNVKTLDPLSVEDDTQLKRTQTVLNAYKKLLGDLPHADFTDGAMARQIIFATAGRLRPLRNLLVRGVEISASAKPSALKEEQLRQAFEQAIWPNCPNNRNPFSNKFDGFPLIRAGEPYAASVRGES